jgi:uncharacterized protein involved in exopolysaccharide biosynthesis
MTWGFGRITLTFSLVGMLVAAAVSFALPVRYLSRAVITLTPANEPTRDLAETVLKLTVLNKELLGSLIQQHDLYQRERVRVPFLKT